MSELRLNLCEDGYRKNDGPEVMFKEAQIYEMERKFEHNRLIKKIIAQISDKLMRQVNREIDWCSRCRRDLRQREEISEGLRFYINARHICGVDISMEPYKFRDLTELERVAVSKLIGDKVSERIRKKCNKGPRGTQASVIVKYYWKYYWGKPDGDREVEVLIEWTAQNGYAGRIKEKEWY
jgi:hypothetical protein